MDLELNGVLPIRVIRRYDSQSRYDSPLGYGWSFDYDVRLYEYADGTMVVRGPFGQRERFAWTGSSYDHVDKARGRAGTLEAVLSGYEYRYPSSHIAAFGAEGSLRELRDPHGHYLEFSYEGDPTPARQGLIGISPYSPNPSQTGLVARPYRLTRIEEFLSGGIATGRRVTLHYDETTGRLDFIESFDGRQVLYGYDETDTHPALPFRGNLAKVTDAEGIEYVYRYEDTQDLHNLTYIEAGQGTAPLVNEYDAEDRVSTQWVAPGTIDEREWTLTYSDPDPQGERVTTVSRRIVDESGGNERFSVSSLRFNALGHVIEEIDGLGNRTTYARTDLSDAPAEPPRKITVTVEKNIGTIANPSYGAIPDRVVTSTFDTSQNRLTRVVTTNGETITDTWTYDHDWVKTYERETTRYPGEFLTTYTFNEDAQSRPINIQSITRRIDDSTEETTTFEYDPTTGLLEKVLLPDVGSESVDVVRSYHDTTPHVGLLESVELDDGFAGDHLKRSFTYDARALLDTVTDANGNVTDLDFDDLRKRERSNSS